MDAERRLRHLVELIGPILLPGWNIVLHVSGERLAISAKDEASGLRCIAKCAAKWEYVEANLHFDLAAFGDLLPRAQAEFVIHELLHGAVNEMRVRGIAHEERVVSNLTGAFVRAMGSPALRRELTRQSA